MRFRRLAIAIMLAAAALPAAGETFTTDAPSYGIDEPDLIEAVLSKLKGMEASGRLAELQAEAQERLRERVTNPPALVGFSKVEKASHRLFDPSIELTRDITDHEGRLVAAQGTRINPLDYTSMGRRLAIIDGRDDGQVKWAQTILDESPSTFVILVAGSYYNLTQQLRRPVYFDQNRRITSRFGINKVPTLVYQQQKRIAIDEIALDH